MNITGVHIVNLTRLLNSANGNPRWLVLLSDGTEAQTSPDADAGYGIENSEYQNVPLTVTMSSGVITRIRRESK